MSYAIDVLQAMFRLSHQRAAITLDAIVERVGCSPIEARVALAALARAELVERRSEGPRLTMTGLAIAAASAPAVRPRRARTTAPAARAEGAAATGLSWRPSSGLRSGVALAGTATSSEASTRVLRPLSSDARSGQPQARASSDVVELSTAGGRRRRRAA